jgi:hypothetical protein
MLYVVLNIAELGKFVGKTQNLIRMCKLYFVLVL